MIVLDTNVLSALMQRDPDLAVVQWLDAQPAESIWTTSITIFEVRFGLDLLAASRRRRQLEEAFDAAIEQELEGRVLAFDASAAQAAAPIAVRQRRAGQPVEIRDVQIAGIVAARKATLATANSRHFLHAGIPLVDPWRR